MTAEPAFFASLITVLSDAAAAHGDSHGGGHGAHHGVDAAAKSLLGNSSILSYFTNSLFVGLLVVGLILWFVRGAMRNAQSIPGRKQNFVEVVIEFLYQQVENIVGPKIAPQAFPLLATIFLFVTISNWFGLLPGVGSIFLFGKDHSAVPLLRPATADMNMTIAIALISLVAWFVITIRELGVGGFLNHTFGPKGGLKGAIKYGLMPIFLVVGVIEVISIMFRPMTLSLRLYGNVFAGENLLHTMATLVHTGIPAVDFICSVVLRIPFFFLEILVGVLQGMVFALLNAVFIKLSTTHEEEHGDEAHH
jgi:F-type H+-transporting ATPase subunit a